jgi:hypothetical protein
MTFSVAMPSPAHASLTDHLLRADGQEDVCLAICAPSTGSIRSSAVVSEILLPGPGERAVHGNASFTGDYFVRGQPRRARAGSRGSSLLPRRRRLAVLVRSGL